MLLVHHVGPLLPKCVLSFVAKSKENVSSSVGMVDFVFSCACLNSELNGTSCRANESNTAKQVVDVLGQQFGTVECCC